MKKKVGKKLTPEEQAAHDEGVKRITDKYPWLNEAKPKPNPEKARHVLEELFKAPKPKAPRKKKKAPKTKYVTYGQRERLKKAIERKYGLEVSLAPLVAGGFRVIIGGVASLNFTADGEPQMALTTDEFADFLQMALGFIRDEEDQ